MLDPVRIAEVQRLLERGNLSQRQVARLTGVSRETVSRVADGRRLCLPRRGGSPAEEAPAGPPRRCPTCGGLVHLPCRLCRIRRLKAEGGKTKG